MTIHDLQVVIEELLEQGATERTSIMIAQQPHYPLAGKMSSAYAFVEGRVYLASEDASEYLSQEACDELGW